MKHIKKPFTATPHKPPQLAPRILVQLEAQFLHFMPVGAMAIPEMLASATANHAVPLHCIVAWKLRMGGSFGGVATGARGAPHGLDRASRSPGHPGRPACYEPVTYVCSNALFSYIYIINATVGLLGSPDPL
jgi:hypothetical protein